MLDYFRSSKAIRWILHYPLIAREKLRRSGTRSQCYRATVKGGRIVIRPQNLDGEFEIDARSDLAARVVECGFYEPDVTQILSLLRDTRGTVVNVGANVGFLAIHIARTFPNADSVVAIEPNPDAFSFLQANIQRNHCGHRIHPLPICIGAQSGQATLAVVAGKSEYSSIGAIVHSSVGQLEQTQHIVPVLPLGAAVKDSVSLIVVDVEGAEMGVLDGASAILDKNRPIMLIECSEQLLRKFGNKSADMASYLYSHQYKAYDIASPRRPITHPFEGELLAIPAERVSMCRHIIER